MPQVGHYSGLCLSDGEGKCGASGDIARVCGLLLQCRYP